MKLQYIRAFIVLVAGLITLIINMHMHKPVIQSLVILLIVILVFYFIGTLAIELLQKSFDAEAEKAKEEQEETTDETEQTEEFSSAFDDDDE